jgi:Restriction endonuclease
MQPINSKVADVWRIVSALEAENIGMDMTITANTHVIGRISRVPRQIDALIESRWESGRTRRILVDAKHRRRKLDVNDIGAFLAMLEDCDAELGILYSPKGWSAGAERLARDLVVQLIS